MIVISDTTPLITLMKADMLSILGELFGEVLLPEAVFSEVTINKTYQDESEIIKNSDFIKVVKVNSSDRVSLLQRATGLDRGESEAIICADEMKADLLLMDEKAGRKIAKNMKLPITGSIGIILRAFQSRVISENEAEEALDKIKTSNSHVADKLISQALAIVHGDLT